MLGNGHLSKAVKKTSKVELEDRICGYGHNKTASQKWRELSAVTLTARNRNKKQKNIRHLNTLNIVNNATELIVPLGCVSLIGSEA